METLITSISLLTTELWNRCRLEFETRFSITSGNAERFLRFMKTKLSNYFYESDELIYVLSYSIAYAMEDDIDGVNDHMERFFDSVENADSFKNTDKIRITEFLLYLIQEMEAEEKPTPQPNQP